MSSKRGLLVAIEGIDGAGKTTLAKGIVYSLRTRGLQADYTMEPTRELIGNLIRSLPEEYRDGRIEALLYAADRLYHYQTYIKPRLENGIIVVVDRYIHSSIAYQGALGAPIDWIKTLNNQVKYPDIAFYVDVSVDVALSRISNSGRRKTFYERKELLNKVRKIYLDLVKIGELILLDGTMGADELVNKALNIILNRIAKN